MQSIKQTDKEVFRSLREVKEFFFPKDIEKEEQEKLMKIKNPKELGKVWAEDTMKKIRKMMNK